MQVYASNNNGEVTSVAFPFLGLVVGECCSRCRRVLHGAMRVQTTLALQCMLAFWSAARRPFNLHVPSLPGCAPIPRQASPLRAIPMACGMWSFRTRRRSVSCRSPSRVRGSRNGCRQACFRLPLTYPPQPGGRQVDAQHRNKTRALARLPFIADGWNPWTPTTAFESETMYEWEVVTAPGLTRVAAASQTIVPPNYSGCTDGPQATRGCTFTTDVPGGLAGAP